MNGEPIEKAGTTGSGIRALRPVRDVADLAYLMDREPWLVEAIRKDPVGTIDKIPRSPLETDKWIYYLVVGALGLTLLISAVGAIVLAAMGEKGREVPQILIAVGSAAVGALAGLLAPSPAQGAR